MLACVVARRDWLLDEIGVRDLVWRRGDDVMPIVYNATGKRHLDVLIIATNTQFSNPAIDWVREWQEKYPRPRVWLWQREQLERLLTTHASVVARLFSDALSSQGQLELVSGRFWEHGHYASTSHLEHFWSERSRLEWSWKTYSR